MERDDLTRQTGSPTGMDMEGMEGRSYGAPGFNPTSGGRFGDTRDIHHTVAENQRRWAGPAGIQGSDSQIAHGGGRTKPFDFTELPPCIQREAERRTALDGSLLRLDNVRTLFANRTKYVDFNTAYNSILNEALGIKDYSDQNIMIDNRAVELVRAMEHAFIHDPSLSSVDLLSPDRAAHFKGIKWKHEDYPGSETGPNEHQADRLTSELNEIRPQRRANSTKDAVVLRDEFDGSGALRSYINSELKPVEAYSEALPGETTVPDQPKGHRLNRHAAEAYHRMREAARLDGVALIIGDSFRSRETAKKNAENAKNSRAVAGYSSHTLGLAFDLHLSYGKTKFDEITTRPFTNVMNMRTSPGHKWVFMHGAEYGFFPLQDEPWHWEYNPVGFKDQFMEEYKASKATAPAKKP